MQSKKYLQAIGKRVSYYFAVREKIIKYIQREKIHDQKLQVNLVVIGAVWAADQINDSLNEDTLLSVFGLESDNDAQSMKVFELDNNHKELTLMEILDITVESYPC